MVIEPDAAFAALLMEDLDYTFTSPITAYCRVLNAAGSWLGIHEYHLGVAGKLCCGFVGFDTPETHEVTTPQSPKWQVESWDPLTLSPSLLCRRCGNHGFLRSGCWEGC